MHGKWWMFVAILMLVIGLFSGTPTIAAGLWRCFYVFVGLGVIAGVRGWRA